MLERVHYESYDEYGGLKLERERYLKYNGNEGLNRIKNVSHPFKKPLIFWEPLYFF